MKRIYKYSIVLVFIFLSSIITKGYNNDTKAIEQCVNSFFKDYFDAYSFQDNSKAIEKAKSNEHLYAFQKAHEVEIRFLKELDLTYKDIKYRVDFFTIEINKQSARVSALADMTFKYNNSKSIESGIYNIGFDLS